MLSNYLSYCAIFPLTPRQLQKYPLGYNYLWMGTTALMDSVPLIDYINLLAISLWHLSASACFPSLVSLLSLLRFIWGATKCSQSAKTFRKGVVRSEGKNKKKEKEDAVWSLTARSASHSVSLLVYPLLLAVLLFSNRILVFFGLLHFVLLCSFEWNLVKGKHMLWRQMSGWGEGGQKKKKHSEGRGGGEGDGGGLKGKKQPPMEWEGGELGRVEGQRKGGMLRWWGGKVTVKGKNSYLMGHKCIKESTMREMFGYFLANYHFGGGGFGSVFE